MKRRAVGILILAAFASAFVLCGYYLTSDRREPRSERGPDKSMVGTVIRYEWDDQEESVMKVTTYPDGTTFRLRHPPDEQ